MKPWLIALIAAVVLTALGGFLIHKFGDASKDTGAAETKATINETIVKVQETDRKNNETIARETETMDDPAIDADLVRLGIMRADDDR